MNRSTLRRVAVPAAVVLSMTAAACGASNEQTTTPPAGSSAGASTSGGSGGGSGGAALSGSINGAGSSAQTAAMQAWIAGFNTTNPSVTVNYDSVGSGSGVKQFTEGGVAFAGTDKAMTTDQLAAGTKQCGAQALDIPTYVSPIAIVYNLQGVDDLQLSPATAAGIFSGAIATWDDPKIKADNPDATLPSTKITPVHRSDKSGTTNNFTDYLTKAAQGVFKGEATEVWPYSGGESANGTSGIVAAVKAGAGTISYADASQAGDLQVAKVKVGEAYTAPSADGAAKALSDSKNVTGRPDGDIVIAVNRTTTADGAYPVLLVSYEAFCTQYPAAQADLVKGLLTYIVSSEGQQAAAKAAGSAPVPDALASQDTESINMIKSGS